MLQCTGNLFWSVSLSLLCNISSDTYNKSTWKVLHNPFLLTQIFFTRLVFYKCTMNKQTFPWHESSVWSIALSQHACFGGLNYNFHDLLPLFTTSMSHVVLLQWNPTLLLYAQKCFSPGEGRACSHFFIYFLPVLCVLNFSSWMRSNTCHMSNKKWVKSFPGNECKLFFSPLQCSG